MSVTIATSVVAEIAEGARENGVFVRAADGDGRRQLAQLVILGDGRGDGAGDQGIGGQRQVRAVLFAGADRQHGNGQAGVGVGGCGGGQNGVQGAGLRRW